MARPRADLRTELSRLKEASGLSIRQLSARAGVPSSTIGSWLTGVHLPDSSAEMLRFVRACTANTQRNSARDRQNQQHLEDKLERLLKDAKDPPGNERASRNRKAPMRRHGGGVATERRYRLEPFNGAAAPVRTELIATQPSRLLASAYHVVPFAYRTEELRYLRAWLDSHHEGLAVKLLHGPGGQGKTRLAMEFARKSDRPPWRVLQARLGRSAAVDNAPRLKAGRAIRALIIVDYADRWPVDLLLELLDEPLVTRGAARVLLVARAPGNWWRRLSYRVTLPGSEADVSEMELRPLTGPREELFRSARDAFAGHFGISNATGVALPGNLDNPAFDLILAMHMAALVAVDAHARNMQAPTDPARLPLYLLRREWEHWEGLHTSFYGDRQAETPPWVMARAVYLATLTGQLPRGEAITALDRAGVASAAENAGRVIDDHSLCYPSARSPDSDIHDEHAHVLEPLYPDLLGEDFIALLTPGHRYAREYKPDDWARTAPRSLLGDPAQAPPDYAHHLMTVKII